MEKGSDYFKVDGKTKITKKQVRNKKKKYYYRNRLFRKSVLSDLLTNVDKAADEGGSKDLLTDNEEDEGMFGDIDSTLDAEMKQKHPFKARKKKPVVCEICDKLIPTLAILRDHIARVHREHDKAKEFKFCCIHCRKVYLTQKALDRHYKLHCGPCEICGKIFKCYGIFYKHRANHDSIEKTKSLRKSGLSPRLGLKSKRVSVPEKKKKHFCNICDKRFAYRFLLKSHMERLHMQQGKKVDDLKCTQCDYVAKNYYSLRLHYVYIHKRKMMKDSEKFHCRYCNLPLISKFSLNSHEKKHDGKFKGPKCNLCNRTFSKQGMLDWHKRNFHGLRKNDGEEEEEDNENDIQNSLTVSEEQSSFPCQSCQLSFTSRHLLEAHTLSVHSVSQRQNIVGHNIVFECPYCSYSFYSGDHLQSHMLSVHNVPCNMRTDITVESRSMPTVVEDYNILEIG